MDKKLLLIQSITLLFRESQIENTATNSITLIRPLAEEISLPEVSVGVMDTERDVLVGLKNIVLDMCDNVDVRKYEVTDLLQKVKYICRDDIVLYETFHQAVKEELPQEKITKLCTSMHFGIKSHMREVKIQEIIQAKAKKLKFNRDEIKDIHKFVAETCAELEPYQTSNSVDKDPAILSTASSTDTEGMEDVFKTSKDLNDDRGIMKTGWQGLNRMLQGGFRRGEMVVGTALQHNWKTGMTLALARQLAIYNVPYMLDPTKKPLILNISFENSLALNMPLLYRNIYENKTGEAAYLDSKTPGELTAYIQSELSVNGYETLFIHVNPNMWTYLDLFNYITHLESQGYEIHACLLDYLEKLPTTGCAGDGTIGSNILEMFTKVRNFFYSKRILFFTPHQMSTEAKQLVRGGNDSTLVQQVANGGYYKGCKSLDQVPDLELYWHIVKVDGKSYLTVQRGKHRLINLTKAEYLYCVLPFEPIGDIRDDINGADTTRKKPGHGPMGSSNETPFWDFEKDAA